VLYKSHLCWQRRFQPLGQVPKLVPGLTKRRGSSPWSPRTPILLAYPKFAEPLTGLPKWKFLESPLQSADRRNTMLVEWHTGHSICTIRSTIIDKGLSFADIKSCLDKFQTTKPVEQTVRLCLSVCLSVCVYVYVLLVVPCPRCLQCPCVEEKTRRSENLQTHLHKTTLPINVTIISNLIYKRAPTIHQLTDHATEVTPDRSHGHSTPLSVRPSTKSFFDFNKIWYVGTGWRVMHDGMQYHLIQGQGHEPLKVGH